jgi:hypothetical protein
MEDSTINLVINGFVSAAILPSIFAYLLIIAFGFHEDLKSTWRLASGLEFLFFAEIVA